MASVTLTWSDDRGRTFGQPLTQSLDNDGTLTQAKWSRLGMARDRVFQLAWTATVDSVLQGAWVDAEPSRT